MSMPDGDTAISPSSLRFSPALPLSYRPNGHREPRRPPTWTVRYRPCYATLSCLRKNSCCRMLNAPGLSPLARIGPTTLSLVYDMHALVRGACLREQSGTRLESGAVHSREIDF